MSGRISQRNKPSPRQSLGAIADLQGAQARFVALGLFVALVAFTGGGSRGDINSLVILRPAAVLFAGYAALLISADQLRRVRAPLAIVGGMMALALLQLVPMSPSVWTAMPQREAIVELSGILGMESVWRPLSLDPNRTWNTFFALWIPLAVVLLVAIQDETNAQKIISLVVLVGLASLALGILQLLGNREFYLYEITNIGRPVGLFSNRNHQAVLLTWLLPAAVWIFAVTRKNVPISRFAMSMFGFGYLLVLFVIFLNGSRAGLLLVIPATLLMLWIGSQREDDRAGRGSSAKASKRRKLTVAIGAIMALLMVLTVAILTTSQSNAFNRFFERSIDAEQRSRDLPVFLEMISDFFPWGAGFGSFENVFKTYETVDMLTSRYLNQAHNDLAQIIIEGGLPAVVILIAALAWLFRVSWSCWRSPRKWTRIEGTFLVGSIALWLLASLVDYPLRAPLSAMIVAVLTVQLAKLNSSARSDAGDLTERPIARG